MSGRAEREVGAAGWSELSLSIQLTCMRKANYPLRIISAVKSGANDVIDTLKISEP